MPEYSDYKPAEWAPDTFAEARSTYDEHVDRGYDDAREKKLTAGDLVPDSMETNVTAPIVILVDQTGSMGDWPSTIFSKLAYLDHEAKFYFGAKYAIAFGAFGDANNNERYPVQMRPFASGKELQDRLKELVIEGQGGSGIEESSELCALYALHNIKAPKAVHPILIIITDEKGYTTISPDQAKQYCKVDLSQRTNVKAVFKALKEKWSVYVIRKPNGRSSANIEDSTNKQVREFWEEIVGADHIAFLPDPNRVVDVIFGIFAEETDKVAEFEKELKDRQLKDKGGDKKVEIVEKALLTIHRDPAEDGKLLGKKSVKRLPAPARQESVVRRKLDSGTVKSKSLLPEEK